MYLIGDGVELPKENMPGESHVSIPHNIYYKIKEYLIVLGSILIDKAKKEA